MTFSKKSRPTNKPLRRRTKLLSHQRKTTERDQTARANESTWLKIVSRHHFMSCWGTGCGRVSLGHLLTQRNFSCVAFPCTCTSHASCSTNRSFGRGHVYNVCFEVADVLSRNESPSRLPEGTWRCREQQGAWKRTHRSPEEDGRILEQS